MHVSSPTCNCSVWMGTWVEGCFDDDDNERVLLLSVSKVLGISTQLLLCCHILHEFQRASFCLSQVSCRS